MRYLSWSFLALALTSPWVRAQPTPAPDSGDAPCGTFPRASVEPDLSQPDAEGFYPLFNGADFKGWWLDCRPTGHAGILGGPIFRVDKARKAIYSTQGRNLAGGALMTNAKFMDYEIVFDYWPDWGNQAALQNRTDTNFQAYSTTLGYMPGTSLGGVWPEAGLAAQEYRPFTFAERDSTIAISQRMPGEVYWRGSWAELTKTLRTAGETFPCSEFGCTQEDWRRLWNFEDWNQIRVVFHGGRSKQDPIHARSWFRKLGAADWVPLWADTTLRLELKAGYIGLRVHGNGPDEGPRGTWYRNIRWKPWVPSPPVAIRGLTAPKAQRPAIRMDGARPRVRIASGDAKPGRNAGVFSPDGKSIVEPQGGGAKGSRPRR